MPHPSAHYREGACADRAEELAAMQSTARCSAEWRTTRRERKLDSMSQEYGESQKELGEHEAVVTGILGSCNLDAKRQKAYWLSMLLST